MSEAAGCTGSSEWINWSRSSLKSFTWIGNKFSQRSFSYFFFFFSPHYYLILHQSLGRLCKRAEKKKRKGIQSGSLDWSTCVLITSAGFVCIIDPLNLFPQIQTWDILIPLRHPELLQLWLMLAHMSLFICSAWYEEIDPANLYWWNIPQWRGSDAWNCPPGSPDAKNIPTDKSPAPHALASVSFYGKTNCYLNSSH